VSVFADLVRKRVLFTTEGKAYQMRLVLQDIYQSPTATVAGHRFRVWCRWVR